MLEEAIVDMQPGPLRAEAWTLLGTGHVYHDGNVEAVRCFERALAEVGDNLALRVQILTALASMLANGARFDDARRAIDDAVSHATRLGHPSLLGRACSARVELRMLQGEGYDDAAMQRALRLGRPRRRHPRVPAVEVSLRVDVVVDRTVGRGSGGSRGRPPALRRARRRERIGLHLALGCSGRDLAGRLFCCCGAH